MTHPVLTPAERRIFTGICVGLTPKAIAQRLGVSRATVYTHRQHIEEKLQVFGAEALLRAAIFHFEEVGCCVLVAASEYDDPE